MIRTLINRAYELGGSTLVPVIVFFATQMGFETRELEVYVALGELVILDRTLGADWVFAVLSFFIANPVFSEVDRSRLVAKGKEFAQYTSQY